MAVEGILQIKDILDEYTEDIQKGIEECAKQVAKEDVDKLKATKNTYKVRSGKYNRGWTSKKESKRGQITYIVHNKDHYQLTHLLEKGHKIIGRNGTVKGYAKAYPHIAPVEEYSNSTFEKKVEEVIRSGG